MSDDQTGAASPAGLVELAAGAMRLRLAAPVGGAIAALHEQRGGERLDWLRPAAPEDLARGDPFAMGSFPRLPWCNRIRDGRAHFGGREVALAASHPAPPFRSTVTRSTTRRTPSPSSGSGRSSRTRWRCSPSRPPSFATLGSWPARS